MRFFVLSYVGNRYNDGYRLLWIERLPVMVSPLFFTAPMFAQALEAFLAPVQPCETSSAVLSFTGHPKVTVLSAPAAVPNPTALPPFFTCNT